jgi:hypothetical protein
LLNECDIKVVLVEHSHFVLVASEHAFKLDVEELDLLVLTQEALLVNELLELDGLRSAQNLSQDVK